MTIDLLNAHHLLKGETYLITLPEISLDEMDAVRKALQRITEESSIEFIIICGNNVSVNPNPVNASGMIN